VHALRDRVVALESQISSREVQQPPHDEIVALKIITARISGLEDLQLLYHGPPPAPEDRPGLTVAFAKRREAALAQSSRRVGLRGLGEKGNLWRLHTPGFLM
jgi:hypothetical protein